MRLRFGGFGIGPAPVYWATIGPGSNLASLTVKYSEDWQGHYVQYCIMKNLGEQREEKKGKIAPENKTQHFFSPKKAWTTIVLIGTTTIVLEKESDKKLKSFSFS